MPPAHPPATALLRTEQHGSVVHLQLSRPAKRNALSDALVLELQRAFVDLPESARAVVLSGAGGLTFFGGGTSNRSSRTPASNAWAHSTWSTRSASATISLMRPRVSEPVK